MIYKKYQHIEKLLLQNGTIPNEEIQNETKGILNGTVYVLPKIDGTNCCVFIDDNGRICYGGRKQMLTIDNDSRGFVKYLSKLEDKIKKLLEELPKNTIIYGEWLVPNVIRNYYQNAWNRFYIFDIVTYPADINITILENKELSRKYESYMNYTDYSQLLDKYELDYIPVLKVLHNPKMDEITCLIDQNHYLIDGVGEGVVVKNYDYKNPYGRRTWGKIVAADFHSRKNEKTTYIKEVNDQDDDVSKSIVDKFLNDDFLMKEINKFIEYNGEFNIKKFPELLNYVKEEFLKDNIIQISIDFKNSSLNFKLLNKEIAKKIKEVLSIK